MDEASALKVVAVRAVETADGAHTLWSDDDRAWASRAAAEVVGADAGQDAFLARRALLVIEKLGARQPSLSRSVRALRWRPWVGVALPTLALLLGIFVDQIDRAQRINILAPPVLILVLWNLGVYVAVVASYVVRYGEDVSPGPLRRMVARVASGWWRRRGRGAMRDAIVVFIDDWARRSASLYGARAARILHIAAAALAIGVISGMYMRGVAFEYRASWESTFLDAPTVRAIAAGAYAPGALVTGIAVPDVDAVAAIRAPQSENAARWLHLMAATLAALVVVPRLLLALFSGLVERHRARHLALPLDEPYFLRLLRGYRGGAARVRVIPYSYTPSAAAIAGLEAVVARIFGGSAAMLLSAPIAYGSDDAGADAAVSSAGTSLVVLFSATATPERETHGAFLVELRRTCPNAEVLLALIDEGAFARRWQGSSDRIRERRGAWRRLVEEADLRAVFVDLDAPDLAAAQADIDVAIAGTIR
jgi:hypothetical protein